MACSACSVHCPRLRTCCAIRRVLMAGLFFSHGRVLLTGFSRQCDVLCTARRSVVQAVVGAHGRRTPLPHGLSQCEARSDAFESPAVVICSCWELLGTLYARAAHWLRSELAPLRWDRVRVHASAVATGAQTRPFAEGNGTMSLHLERTIRWDVSPTHGPTKLHLTRLAGATVSVRGAVKEDGLSSVRQSSVRQLGSELAVCVLARAQWARCQLQCRVCTTATTHWGCRQCLWGRTLGLGSITRVVLRTAEQHRARRLRRRRLTVQGRSGYDTEASPRVQLDRVARAGQAGQVSQRAMIVSADIRQSAAARCLRAAAGCGIRRRVHMGSSQGLRPERDGPRPYGPRARRSLMGCGPALSAPA